MPSRMPLSTLRVCFPWNVASRVTSRHHCTMVAKIKIRPRPMRRWSYLFMYAASPATKNSLPKLPVRGQGL